MASWRPPARCLIEAALAVTCGIVTAVAIAIAGALRGQDVGNSTAWFASPAEATLENGEATVFMRERSSWCIDQLRFQREAPYQVTKTRVVILWGGWGGHIDAKRAKSLPRGFHPPQGKFNERCEYQFGWPARCLWAASDAEHHDDIISDSRSVRMLRVWPLSGVSAESELLERDFIPFDRFKMKKCYFAPTGVLPIGIAIDAAAFTPVWWLLFAAPRLRRALRLRRNHCPTCNYDLRAKPAGSPCPECGAPGPSV